MPARNSSKDHVTHEHRYALLIVDMLNRLDFPGAKGMLPQAKKAAAAIKRLKLRARQARVPVIYVNDSFGKWRSDWRKALSDTRAADSLGHELAELLWPDHEDYFVLKPRYSGFYSSALDLLLRELRTKHLIITGIATNICVLYTAYDAYIRDYEISVPSDCVAALSQAKTKNALSEMREAFKVRTPKSASIKFGASTAVPRASTAAVKLRI